MAFSFWMGALVVLIILFVLCWFLATLDGEPEEDDYENDYIEIIPPERPLTFPDHARRPHARASFDGGYRGSSRSSAPPIIDAGDYGGYSSGGDSGGSCGGGDSGGGGCD